MAVLQEWWVVCFAAVALVHVLGYSKWVLEADRACERIYSSVCCSYVCLDIAFSEKDLGLRTFANRVAVAVKQIRIT